MSNLEQEYLNLAEDIVIGSAADGIPKVEEFFKVFSQLAAENGDCPDLTYSPILSGSGYRVDGYAFDIPEDTSGASGCRTWEAAGRAGRGESDRRRSPRRRRG